MLRKKPKLFCYWGSSGIFCSGEGPHPQEACRSRGSSIHTGIIHVPSPKTTVGHDTIENIEFPSFLINSPEVKNECNSVNIWSLETVEGSMY